MKTRWKSAFWEKGEKEAELTYDGHEGVEVADVEALAGHVDEELDDSGSVFLLHRLQEDMKTHQSAGESGSLSQRDILRASNNVLMHSWDGQTGP